MEENTAPLIQLAKNYITKTFGTPTKRVIKVPSFYRQDEIIKEFLEYQHSEKDMQIVIDPREAKPPVDELIPGQEYYAEIIPIMRDTTIEECLQYLFSRNNIFIGMHGLLCLLRWCYFDLFPLNYPVEIIKSPAKAFNRIYLLEHDTNGQVRLFGGAPIAFSGPYKYEDSRHGVYRTCLTFLNEIKAGSSLFCFTKPA